MSIADFNTRIKIQTNTFQIDDIGNHIPIWHDYYDCWCHISTPSGRETSRLDTTTEIDRLYFEVRYCQKTAVLNTTRFRIIYKDHIYNIDNVDHASFKNRIVKIHAKSQRR